MKQRYLNLKKLKTNMTLIKQVNTLVHYQTKAKKVDFTQALLEKLPDVLTLEQKQNKIKNYLQELRKEGFIVSDGKHWQMAK
jgi:hypothetical protein